MIKKKIKTWGYIHSFSLFSLGYKFIVSNLFISVKETLLKLFFKYLQDRCFYKTFILSDVFFSLYTIYLINTSTVFHA